MQTLNQRLSRHRYDCKTQSHRPIYAYINSNCGFDNIKIILIEKYKYKNKKQLRMREKHHMDLYGFDNLCNQIEAYNIHLVSTLAVQKFRNKNNKIILCSCGHEYIQHRYYAHIKTKKHLE
jgi:hypothetical protein